MYELNASDANNVKEETEENSLFSFKRDHTSTSIGVHFDSPTSNDLSAASSQNPIQKNSVDDEEVKVEHDILTVSIAVKSLVDVIKVEFQDTGDPKKESLRVSKESEVHIPSTVCNGKEKKNKVHRNKRKQSNKTLQNYGSAEKKKSTTKKCTKKAKHKKYEKPSDQVLKHYQCTLCPKVFQRSSNFNAHQRTHNHLTARPFSCKDCKNTFHYRCQLRDHARIHTGERPFKCHSCSKTFARKGCLVAHMVTHSDALPFQCGICCKRFARKYNLAKHVQSHSGDRPYHCLNCSRRFKCKQSLDKHHRIHELNIYACAICQQSFDTKRRLTRHNINEHVSYRPFTCQICHKPFIFKSQLTYHIKEHNLERPYSCGKCNKSYFKKGHLLSHIKQYCSDDVPVPQIKLEVLN